LFAKGMMFPELGLDLGLDLDLHRHLYFHRHFIAISTVKQYL